MKNRILALVLALMLILSSTAFAAYSTVEKPITEEVVTYTVMVKHEAEKGSYNDMWCYQWIEENLGIRFEFIEVDSNAWKEKLGLAFASDELPDLFLYGLDATDIVTYGSQGYFVELTDLIAEYAPNVQQAFDLYPEVKKAVTTPDGNVYCVPKFLLYPERDLTKQRVYMNLQWLENLGLEEPQTVEDLAAVLTAFAEQDADGDGDATNEIAFGGRYEGEWCEYYWCAAYGMADKRWDVTDEGTVVYTPAMDNYFEMVKMLNSLWEAGVIDPEFFSQTEEQYTAKSSSVLHGMFSTWGANWTLMSDPDDYLQYSMIEPVTSSVNPDKIWPAKNMMLQYSIAIVDGCENIETLMKFINWTYTTEAEIVWQYGPELGVYDDLNGWSWVVYEGKAAMQNTYDPERFTSFNNFRQQVAAPMTMPYSGFPEMKAGETVEIDGVEVELPYDFYTRMIPTQVILTNDTLDHGKAYYTSAYPDFVLTTAEENTRITQIDTDIEAFMKQSIAKFIRGDEELTEETWAAYIDGLNARGLAELVQIKQSVYDRYMAG